MARNSRVLVQQFVLIRKLLPPGPLALIPTSIPASQSSHRPFSTSAGAQNLLKGMFMTSVLDIKALTERCSYPYESALKNIQDGCLDAVCAFYTRDQSMHLSLIFQGFAERYPHVKPYHFMVYDVHQDGYEAAMRRLNFTKMPSFQFFQNGKQVHELVVKSFTLLDKTLENLYSTQELDTYAKEIEDHKGAVGQSESKVSAS